MLFESYKIIRSNRKTLCLQVLKTGELVVRAPCFFSEEKISRFVDSKNSWINRKRKMLTTQHSTSYKEGSELLYLGNKYLLYVLDKDFPYIYFDKAFFISRQYIDNAYEFILKWYNVQAQRYFNKHVNFLCERIGCKYSRIRISNAKTLWGSCSQDRKLNFNWRLIMAPSDVAHYVIVHEVMHFFELNHSPAFWKLVAKFSPEYKASKKWLRENGNLLVL